MHAITKRRYDVRCHRACWDWRKNVTVCDLIVGEVIIEIILGGQITKRRSGLTENIFSSRFRLTKLKEKSFKGLT